jgi:pyruvate ferredoxin oxidoreductase alpha subunit
VKYLSSLKVCAVLDRSSSLDGIGGPVFTNVRSALYEVAERPKLLNYILGGRDTDLVQIRQVFNFMEEILKGGKRCLI